MSRTTDGILPSIVRIWKPLVASATWIVATFCSGLTFAIKISATSDLDGEILACANALVAIVVGLIALFALRANKSRTDEYWTRFSVGNVVLFLLSFFLFVTLRGIWTCQYVPGVRLVMGSTASPNLVEYMSTFGGPTAVSCSTLMTDYAGDTERMYARGELIERFVILVAVFFVMWCSLSAAVVSIAYGMATHARRARAPKGTQP